MGNEDINTRRPINEADLRDAVSQLQKTDKGRAAMRDLLNFLDESGLGLDAYNQNAVLVLLVGAFSNFSGTARDLMREVVG